MDLERIVSLFNVNLDGCFFVDLLCNNDDVIEILDVFLMKFMLIIWLYCNNFFVFGVEC